VKLAAKEVRRYVYLRTGELLDISCSARGPSIVLRTVAGLGPQEYRLKTEGGSLAISGGSDVALLYGAYAFAEKLGIRFYLHGDVVPDEKIRFSLPVLDETRRPLFTLRGVNPWGSHPFGFDAWSTDDYKAIFTQLAKMRMNFLGIHCYPEGHPYAEPTVWHGLTGDFDPQGHVKSSYPSRYYNTLITTAWGGYLPKKTSDYSFGGSLLFERDDWAPPVMAGCCPIPVTPEECNDVFNRTALQFRDAFSFARKLGVKTCIGTEVPLILPNALARRTNDVRAVYEGTFRRIMASHPLDYYWLWTPEGWTWGGNKPQEYSNTVHDVKIAVEALLSSGAPFKLAACGWVLGPQHDRAAFDADLPKDIPMSAISRDLGATAVDPAFGHISGREKWAIPWLESDGRNGLATVQLEAGRMRRDAVDALAYGCTGLMGLHWRTEILSPNVSALAQAGWDQSFFAKGNEKLPRSLPCGDFYADWAKANFGRDEIGRVFAAIDGRVPQVTDGDCPSGRLTADSTPWSVVVSNFAFVAEMEKERCNVSGAGNLDRFDYWLNTFKYHRSLAQLRCALVRPDAAELMQLYSDSYRYLLSTVNSPGGLAMVVNMESHPGWGPLIAGKVSKPWPKGFQGRARLIVPAVRSVVDSGESLVVKIIALDEKPFTSVVILVRSLGKGKWRKIQATHTARAVWSATIPGSVDDFEYQVVAESATGAKLIWPSTAPELNQTVVVGVWNDKDSCDMR